MQSDSLCLFGLALIIFALFGGLPFFTMKNVWLRCLGLITMSAGVLVGYGIMCAAIKEQENGN